MPAAVDGVPAPAEAAKYSEQPPWIALVAGTAGGAAAVFVAHPFDSIKVRLQSGATTGLFRSLFAGVAAPLATVTPVWSFSYCAYAASQRSLEEAPLLVRDAVCGALCGVVIAAATCSSDVVKVHAQNQRTGALSAARDLYRAHGAKMLLHGSGPTALHLGTSQAIFFVVYEHLLRRWAPAGAGGLDWRPAVAGGVAGVLEWTICLPLDVVKTRHMLGPLGASYESTVRTVFAEAGWRGFYRGYLPVLLRAVPVNTSAFFIIEMVTGALR
ncbi:mitochondrial carrier domain-containing protein [Pelagophyceae sp. CCMP2097]|nr:mitochondrial carrier domain-containing protein [Pelagophyceae sp. CCMP2097]|mmetsp:Transcript_16143/g.56417  ORF Transcript_16143/g.56417 Transcript_16143/m.56417 type:complete len:270 (+) Transcript_16143:185-994(+)